MDWKWSCSSRRVPAAASRLWSAVTRKNLLHLESERWFVSSWNEKSRFEVKHVNSVCPQSDLGRFSAVVLNLRQNLSSDKWTRPVFTKLHPHVWKSSEILINGVVSGWGWTSSWLRQLFRWSTGPCVRHSWTGKTLWPYSRCFSRGLLELWRNKDLWQDIYKQ